MKKIGSQFILIIEIIIWNLQRNIFNQEVVFVSMPKKVLYDLIEEASDKDILDIIDFANYLKLKNEEELFKDLQLSSERSTDFWNNDIDDEVWNNV